MTSDPNRAAYETPRIVDHYATREELQPAETAILQLLRPELPAARMLDLGVGGGRTTPHFAPLVADYTGADYSPPMIEACRARFPSLRFEVADVRMLPFEDAAFDFVLFSYNGLDYIGVDERPQALKELRRVCRIGAAFAFSTHNLLSLPKLFALRLPPRRLVTAWRMRRRNPPLRDLLQHDAVLVRDPGLGFALTTCYVRPSAQVKALEDAGFTIEAVFGNDEDPWLYFLCRAR